MKEYTLSRCYMCGKAVKAYRTVEICSDCGTEMRKREQAAKATSDQDHRHYAQCSFEMVKDMIHVDAGGFAPGARFTKDEMIMMLSSKMLATGTTVKYLVDNTLWHVDYDGVNNGYK